MTPQESLAARKRPQEKLVNTSDHKMQWCEMKMDKKVREFYTKKKGHHKMLWCPL